MSDQDAELDQKIAKLIDKKLANMPVGGQLLYTRKQGARLLGVSISSVQILIDRGEIRTKQWGKRKLIPHDELVRVSKQNFSEIWPEKRDGKTVRMAS